MSTSIRSTAPTAPNGWGRPAVSYFNAAYADRLAIVPAVTHVYTIAEVAARGADTLLGAREAALAAIAEAEADDFSVGEDLSVTDNYARGSADERAARQAAAMGHRNYIAHHAALLHAENQRIAAQLNTGAVQIAGMTPAHWRQPVSEFGQSVPRSSGVTTSDNAIMENRKGAIHAVDNHTWRREPAPPELPLDPARMSAEQALAAYEDLKHDMARYSDRCLRRPFVLLQERAAFDACVADSGALNERKAALEARLRSLGVQVEPAPSPAHGPPETTDTPPFPPPTRISGFTGHGAE